MTRSQLILKSLAYHWRMHLRLVRNDALAQLDKIKGDSGDTPDEGPDEAQDAVPDLAGDDEAKKPDEPEVT